MQGPDKNIIIFTSTFPYGKGEQFLETEIVYLCKNFKTVYILPGDKSSEKRSVPANCTVLEIDTSFKPEKKIRHYILKNLASSLKILFYTLLRSGDRKSYMATLKKHLLRLSFVAEVARKYLKELQPYLSKVEVLYFYWFVDPALHFAILKQQGKIKQKLLTRAHGYDYDQQQGRFPIYREFELKMMNKVLPVSKYGLHYLKKRYTNIRYNAEVSYLGTNDFGLTPFQPSTVFHLVSCSAFHPVKRVHLIVDILKHLSLPVKWTHFGSGDLENAVREQAASLPANVTVDFKGMVDNTLVINFYKENHVDIFINVSELEGIPVSIMEAISFGIPVIGCDICGVPEIVNAETGYLIEKDFLPATVAGIILKHHAKSEIERQQMNQRAKSFWDKTFNADKNYNWFINNILKNPNTLCAG